jgi:hemolysin activation/secretion protein
MAARSLRVAVWASSSLPAALLGVDAVGAAPARQAMTDVPSGPSFYITEYRVTGATKLTEMEKGEAVYPFLGPGRTGADIDAARAALEKAYKAKGFETVLVEVPVPAPRGGVVHLRVVEAEVGRVRVNGSRYFLPSQIVKHAPSLAPQTVPNFQAVQRDMLALNQWPDRRVTPVLKPGAEPGTVDIDLNVEDKLPLHGSVELNNRYSLGTTELRLNGSLSYNNLWQRGHSIGASFQISPEDVGEVKVFSGFYTARFPQWPGFSLLVQGTKQDSNVSTLGGSAVAGRGGTLGPRAIFNLPPGQGFYHSASVGFDYKSFDQILNLAESSVTTPITYYPFTAGYSAGWAGKMSQTALNAGVTFAFRGAGSDDAEFDLNRFKAHGSFIYLRGDLEHTQELPGGAQLYGKVQGQVAGQPLVSSEQFAGGGLGTVRGYLEAEALGDNGVFGTLELRSPSLLGWTKRKDSEWRVYGFVEGGGLTLWEPLPEQQSRFELASVGLGTRLQLSEHFHGSLDVGFPLRSLTNTQAGDVMFTFRLWSEF